MKSFLLSTLLFATTLTIAAPAISLAQSAPENSTGTVEIVCGQSPDPSSKSTLPATIIKTSNNPEDTVLIIWKSEFFGTKYTPQQRCSIVSTAMNKAIKEGRTYIGSGLDKKTGLGIICAVANVEQSCDRTNMLLTMKSYQSAEASIEQMGEIMQGKTGQPLYQSSGGKRVNVKDLLLKPRSK